MQLRELGNIQCVQPVAPGKNPLWKNSYRLQIIGYINNKWTNPYVHSGNFNERAMSKK